MSHARRLAARGTRCEVRVWHHDGGTGEELDIEQRRAEELAAVDRALPAAARVA